MVYPMRVNYLNLYIYLEFVTYANGLQMSAIWGACTLALDMFVVVSAACIGTARDEKKKKRNKI